jgi:predicted nucleic acid-binding protein
LPREELNTHEFLQSLTTIAADAVICQEAGHINLALRRRGQTIGVADLIIAATASAVDVPLITNNVKHFTIPGLTIIRGTTGTRFVRERRQRYATR